MSTFESVKETTEKAVSFVEWLAEVLRGRNWVTKLLLFDALLILFLNPLFLARLFGFIPKAFLPETPTLPDGYTPVFWAVVGAVGVAALIVAYRTVPRNVEAAVGMAEHKAIKGLRSFGFADAEVFARLQREAILRECLATVTDCEFRFGVLCGESGCGKTSFLQAGLWPRLLKQNHQCIYIKITEFDPLDSLRQALAEMSKLPPEQTANGDFLALLATVAPAGSPPLVLLFDQFEQFFVHHQRKDDREPFMQALAVWYKCRQPLPVKILICLREDFYGRLIELQKTMGYSLGPQQSLRLEKFTPREAAAIFRVIAETEGLPCDADFVQELTEMELAGREDGLISAVDLQILAWMIRGQQSAGERAFNRTAFQKLGGLEGLLERFLSRALQVRETDARRQAALKVLLALTDQERNARAGVLSAEEVEKKLAGTVATEEVQEALEWLARGDVRLATPIEREESINYELAHEHLIPALCRLAGKALSAVDQANQLLDRRVNEWLGNNRARRYLLTWRELRLIRRQKPYLFWCTHVSQKEALLKRSWRRLQVYAVTISLMGLILVTGLAWWFSPSGQIWQVKRDLFNLTDKVYTIKTLTEVAEALVMVGNLEKALQAANRIDSVQNKVPALIRIATATSHSGDIAKASAIFKQAIEVAEKISNKSIKARALASIALPVAQSGNKIWASTLLEQARKIAEGIVDPWGKADASVVIAVATAQTGDETKASTLFEQVGQMTDGIQDAADKAVVLSQLALITEEAGDKIQALTFFKQALGVIQRIHDPEEKSTQLARVLDESKVLVRESMSLGLIDQAIQITEGIDKPKYKSFSMAAISIFLARRGDKTRALAFLEQASKVTEGIREPDKKSESQATLVECTAWVASLTEDKGLLDQGREIAEKIANPDSKSKALREVRNAEDRFARDINAKHFLEQVRSMNELFDKGNWRRAREIAATLPDEDRASFLAKILKTWAESRNPALAKTIKNGE